MASTFWTLNTEKIEKYYMSGRLTMFVTHWDSYTTEDALPHFGEGLGAARAFVKYFADRPSLCKSALRLMSRFPDLRPDVSLEALNAAIQGKVEVSTAQEKSAVEATNTFPFGFATMIIL